MHGRRTNKSHKVPNVKLRPALPQASTSMSRLKSKTGSTKTKSQFRRFPSSTDLEHDIYSQADNTQYVDWCPRPFKGVVVCATGVEDKTTLFKQAMELGAVCTPDFTDRVTHLVACGHGGLKYQCALDLKIPIMRTSWISDSYEVWKRGDDVDLDEVYRAHRLPTFSGVNLCLSGIEDVGRRTKINKLVTNHGGVYTKNISRPVKVTHLVCSDEAGPEQTDKMKYAEKFNRTGEADIKIVWEEWFWDSLDFGGQFDEEKYLVKNPRPMRRSEHVEQTEAEEQAISPPPSSSPQPETGSSKSRSRSSNAKAATRPGPSDSADPADENGEEIAQVKRVPAVTLQVWESLLKSRGFNIVGDRLVRSPTKPPPKPVVLEVWPEDEQQSREDERREKEKEVPIGGKSTLLSKFKRTKSFTPVPSSQQASTARRLFSRTISVNPNADGASQPQVEVVSRIFEGKRFRLLGEARAPNVRIEIEKRCGVVVGRAEDEQVDSVDFVVVRLVSGSKLYRDEPDETLRPKYRTECWLERCMFDERVVEPDERVYFRPLTSEIPGSGAETVDLGFSGLEESDACGIRRLVRALGASVAPSFSRRTTHLLCPSAMGAKFEKAKEWNIPVVGMRWLEAWAKEGRIPLSEEYLVGEAGELAVEAEPGREDLHHTERDAASEHVPMETDAEAVLELPAQAERSHWKGKGKAQDPPADDESMMVDITNNPRAASPAKGERHHGSAQSSAESENNNSFGSEDKSIQDYSLDSLIGAQPRDESFGLPAYSLDLEPQARPLPSRACGLSAAHSSASVEGGVEQDHERIPSSQSPSPLKGTSPALLERQDTNELQTKITSLLGKRGSEDDSISFGSGESGGYGSGSGDGAPGRAKRARPLSRSKLPFGSRSEDSLTSPTPGTPAIPARQKLKGDGNQDEEFLASFVSRAAGRSHNALELFEQEQDGQAIEDSMRVTYEDPGQRAEQAKLAKLLKERERERERARARELEKEGKGGRKKLVRRAGRVSGPGL